MHPSAPELAPQGRLAAGQRFSKASEVAFRRAVGMMFGQPAAFVQSGLPLGPVGKETNWVGDALLPAQAPLALTVPPQGSMIGVMPGAEKSPPNSAGVGTVVKTGEAPWRRRKPSQLKNQNVLSLPS